MKLRLIVPVLLFALAADAQVAGPVIVPPARALTLPLLADDANTVVKVVWRNGALVDLRGNAWTQQGTVPQVSRTATTPAGAGPFTSTDYYSLGTGSDVLDFAGDFSICFVFAFTGVTGELLANGADLVSGYRVHALPTGLMFDTNGTSTRVRTITANAPISGAVNVGCAGRAGSTQAAKLNLGTYTVTAGAQNTPGTSWIAQIGRYTNGTLAFPGTIFEAWISTTTPSDAICTAAAQRVKQRLGITAW